MTNYFYSDALKSERLVTRFLTEDDIIPWTSFCADEESIEFFPKLKLITPQQASEQWIRKQMDRYSENRYGLQAILHKQTGELIGQCGLLAQEVGERKELEVGYHVFKKFWGQGYAPEAAKAFITYAFQHNIVDSVISIIDVKNIKSQKVAEKNNLVQDTQLTWNEIEAFIYRIKKTNFQKQ